MLIDSLMRTKGLTREEVIDELNEKMLSKDSDMKNLAQEYYDGTLMYEISKSEVWDKAAKDEDGLAAYFEANKKKYAWDEPRFKGIVVHVKSEDLLAKAKKLIKKVDEADWATTIVKEMNNDSVKVVRIERGIYKKGDNANVDYLVFKTGEPKPMKDYPYATTFGKVLKKPKSHNDVRGVVTTDYQNELEKQWVENLRKKYAVEIDKAVLSTVNNH